MCQSNDSWDRKVCRDMKMSIPWFICQDCGEYFRKVMTTDKKYLVYNETLKSLIDVAIGCYNNWSLHT